MEPFVNQMCIEIDQTHRIGDNWDIFAIKDMFLFNSTVNNYGQKDTIIPLSLILNKEELPNQEHIKHIINNREPVMKRVIDLNNQTENWVFIPKKEN